MVTAHIKGVAPLILSNGDAADPQLEINRLIDKIKNKKPRTEADVAEMDRLGYMSRLYLDNQGDIVIPAKVVVGCLIAGARKSKHGKAFQAGVFCTQPSYPLIYDGPRTAIALWESGQFTSREMVKQQQSRIPRVRPIFREWELKFSVELQDDAVDVEMFTNALTHAGRLCGIGDWRPQHGRFEIISVK
jgi:hypothetical protein